MATATAQLAAPKGWADDSADAQREDDLFEKLRSFVAKHESEAQRRVDRRSEVERRWLDDLRQYHGLYDPETMKALNDSQMSMVYLNQTAPKTEAMEARLWDLLFPTDDKNYGVEPTPVPELAKQADAARESSKALTDQTNAAQQEAQRLMDEGKPDEAQAAEGQMRQLEQQESEAQAAADALAKKVREAADRAALMEKEIDDQFVTCDYQAECRRMISDACKIGLGVMKGPVINEAGKQCWMLQEDGSFALVRVRGSMPGAYWCDPWSFFPDPDVRDPDDMDGIYERHLMNEKQLRRMKNHKGINKQALRELLRQPPSTGSLPNNMNELYDLTGQAKGQTRNLYQVWEYTGVITWEDLECLFDSLEDGVPEDMEAEFDELEEIHVRMFFCNGRVLKFALHPLDSNEAIYSCYTIREDETSVFGFGIPWIMRHPQVVLNGAIRMMMDNSGLSTGPQIVINKEKVEPEDGNWTLFPRKVWVRTGTINNAADLPFQTFNIPSNQAELGAIIELANAFIDEMTAMPKIAQGEQGTGITKTAQGMALLMNSANVVFRRIVKMFDDYVTVPMVRRFYHWNMQFSDKQEIKGDYDVKARGAGVLLVREMQAQNLMLIASSFGDHPIYGPMLNHMELLRQIFRAHMIGSETLMKTQDEYEAYLEEQKQNPSPEVQAAQIAAEAQAKELEIRKQELDAKVAIAEADRHSKETVAQWDYHATLQKAVLTGNITQKVADERAALMDRQLQQKDRSLAVEVAMRDKTGDSAGGAV